MTQPPLPFRHLQIPEQTRHWFRHANGGDYPEKQFWFYPFKARFLCAHAVPDGVTIQTLIKRCWCGDGIWRGIGCDLPKRRWDMCWRCNGTGIYGEKQIVLLRWDLCGRLYHFPTPLRSDAPGLVVRDRISGLIHHGDFSAALATHAMERLLLRYEPRNFLYLWLARIRRRKQKIRQRLWWRYQHLQYAVTARWKQDEEERDPPF